MGTGHCRSPCCHVLRFGQSSSPHLHFCPLELDELFELELEELLLLELEELFELELEELLLLELEELLLLEFDELLLLEFEELLLLEFPANRMNFSFEFAGASRSICTPVAS